MNTPTSTLVPMRIKTETINIKVTEAVKTAVADAAKSHNRDVGPWLLYLAAQADEDVAKAMGVKRMTLEEALMSPAVLAHQDALRKLLGRDTDDPK